MFTFVFQLIFILSLGGMAFLAVHKMPSLRMLSPEMSFVDKRRLKTVFLEKSKRAGEMAGKMAKASTQKSLQYSAKFATKITSKIYQAARKPEAPRIQEDPKVGIERRSSIEQGHGYWQNLKDKSNVKAKRSSKTAKKEI